MKSFAISSFIALSALSLSAHAAGDIAAGKAVVVVDDEDRENEGDLIMAAEYATPEAIAFFLHHTSGYICAPVTEQRARELELDLMVRENTESMRTAFTVSVDVRQGTTTGISAHRSHERLLEPDRLAPARHEEHFVVAVGETHVDQLVVAPELHGDEAAAR